MLINLIKKAIMRNQKFREWESAVFGAGIRVGFDAGMDFQKSIQENRGCILSMPKGKELQSLLKDFRDHL